MKVDESCRFNVCILLFGVKEKTARRQEEKIVIAKSSGNGYGSF